MATDPIATEAVIIFAVVIDTASILKEVRPSPWLSLPENPNPTT